MKKNLRMLFLGFAAAAFGTGFAQENVTDKLLNADISKGVLGWDLTFTDHIWQKQTKNYASYHGFNDGCLQNWKGDASTGLTNSSVSQTLKNLPNGTYVFGAYLAAAKKDSVANRDQVEGVYLYANEVAVPVATNWPEHTSQQWSHTAKFNVAANVTDGTLTVGIKNEETNANFIIFDNATLYYFGNTDTETALNEMAKIDLAASVALADTCKAHVMHVDTLAQLNTAIAAAQAVTGVEGAYEADEALWWAFRLARASVSDYRGLNNAIVAADEIANMEWTEAVAGAVAELKALIEAAQASYTAANVGRAAINDIKNELTEASAYVELDAAYERIDEVTALLDGGITVGNGVGEYSELMVARIEELLELIGQVLGGVEEKEIQPTVGKHKCDSMYAIVDDILANPITFDAFPITLTRSEQLLGNGSTKYGVLEGAAMNTDKDVVYTSKTFRFEEPLKKVRFIVRETGNNSKCGDFVFFSLSGFEMFDEDGNEIELKEDMLYSNADHNRLNPNALDGGGLAALIDDDPTTFFHSTWKTVLEDHHYLEVTLPEGDYSAFSFAMTARHTVFADNGDLQYDYTHQFPAVMEITYKSDVLTQLQNAVVENKGFKPYQGTAPGFYKADVSGFYEAVAEAEALLESEGVTDAQAQEAIDKLASEKQKIEEGGFIMPEPGKLYRIISAGPFFANQNVHKALTVHSDSARQNWIWWETASPDSAQQLFSFEYIENEENLPYYAVKHEATGKYIGQLITTDEDGETSVVSNTAGLNDEKDTVEIKSLGFGQFGIWNDGQFHTGDHNGGVVKTGSSAVYGCEHAVLGDKSGICKWTTGANSGSAWYIREVQKLPFEAKSITDLNFKSEAISLYSGVNTLTLTADKDCAFADLVVYGTFGDVIPASVTGNGAVATVVLDTTVVETFSFSFTNSESVVTVTVDGVISELSVLQDAFDAAVAVNPTLGDSIGQYSNLDEYNAAIAAAKELLQNGGSDEVIKKAVADLDSALVHLNPNLPLADKTYFIVSALPAFKANHGVDVAIYAKEDNPAWSYVNINNPAWLWKFVETDRVNNIRSFYLQNVGTGEYLGCSEYLSEQLLMVSSPDETRPFQIDVYEGLQLIIRDSKWGNANLHLLNHGGGANASGGIVYWESTVGTASAFKIVESEAYIKDYLDYVGIEDVEIADEYVAPAKKGVYDLYGRRIDAPAATGIYIVDGKKRVIKK